MKTKKEELWDVLQQLRWRVMQEPRKYSREDQESCLLAKGKQDNLTLNAPLTQKYFGQNEDTQEDTDEDRLAERQKFDSVNHLHTGTTWIDLKSLIPRHTSSLSNRASLQPHAMCLGWSYVQVRAGCSHDLAVGTAPVFSGSPAPRLCLHHAKKC